MTNEQKARIEHLTLMLNEACRRYYTDTDEGPAMSDILYDKLLKELTSLEKETGYQLPNTPNKRVGFAIESSDKAIHQQPILSLKDTKSIDELLHFMGEHSGVLSWKLDGLSIVLYYVDGYLVNALTRGDGVTGQVILNNVLKMRGVPTQISSKGSLIVRGEGCLSLKEFEQILKTKEGEKYANARSAAAGIINTSTAPSILLKHMSFVAHSIVSPDQKAEAFNTRTEQFGYLDSLGFNVVPYSKVLNFELKRIIDCYTRNVPTYEFPVDGLVLTLNNIKYGEARGRTAKFPKHSMAFKWKDERKLTKVVGMKWSVSRTGLITPVALLRPVSLEGTSVKQANLHNLKFFEGLGIGIGDTVKVYKANKMVPEIEENMTRSKTEKYPRKCPVCGGKTTVVETEKTRKLYCYSCTK